MTFEHQYLAKIHLPFAYYCKNASHVENETASPPNEAHDISFFFDVYGDYWCCCCYCYRFGCFFLFCFFVVAFFVQFAPFDGISAHYKWIPMSGRRKNNNNNAVYRYYGMLKLIKSNKTHKSNISSSSESNNNQCK